MPPQDSPTTPPSASHPDRGLRWMYVLALVLIAGLTAGAHLTLRDHVTSGGPNAMKLVVDQKRHAETARGEVVRAYRTTDTESRGLALDRLEDTIRTLVTTQASLHDGNRALGLVRSGAQLRALYESSGSRLEEFVAALRELAGLLRTGGHAPGTVFQEAELALDEVRHTQRVYSEQLEMVFTRHELELERANASVQERSTVLLISTLVILVLVAAFVLEPAVRAVRRQFEHTESLRVRAEAGARAKSQFLTNMSHEIRTPMAAILGYAELIEDPGTSREDRAAALQTLRRSGTHLLGLIEDLLDLSRAEAGQLRIAPVPCRPADLAADAVAMMRLRAESKGLRLSLAIDEGVPEGALLDQARVRQILVNLVGNAVKYTDRGAVEVELELGEEDGRRVLCWRVTDTGPGIAPRELEHIFEPFVRAEGTGERGCDGTGLGLTISQRLAHDLGGAVRATSEPGAGSTFELVLPCAPADVRCDPEPERSGAATPNREKRLAGRVLLAEDGVDNRRLLRAYLVRAGLRVDVAHDGAEAVEQVRRARDGASPYALVLMDLQMPVMDGLAATREIRDLGVVTPILALTAGDEPETRERSAEAGCDGFLTKPIARAKLVEVCASWIGKRHDPGRRDAA